MPLERKYPAQEGLDNINTKELDAVVKVFTEKIQEVVDEKTQEAVLFEGDIDLKSNEILLPQGKKIDRVVLNGMFRQELLRIGEIKSITKEERLRHEVVPGDTNLSKVKRALSGGRPSPMERFVIFLSAEKVRLIIRKDTYFHKFTLENGIETARDPFVERWTVGNATLESNIDKSSKKPFRTPEPVLV